jgi:hypothetical protein
MSIGFLNNESTLNFCVNLGQNSSDTCATLSKTYEGEAMKKLGVFGVE